MNGPSHNSTAPDSIKDTILGKITRDSAALIISRVLCLILSLLRIGIISRYLGVESFGLYSFGLSLAAMVTVFGNFGFSTLIVRDGARQHGVLPSLVSNALILKVCFFTFIVMGTCAAMNILKTDNNTQLVLVFLLISFSFHGLSQVYISLIRALERIRLIAILNIIVDSITLLCVVYIFLSGRHLAGLVIALAVVGLFRIALFHGISKRIYPFIFLKPSLKCWKYFIVEGYAIGIIQILLQIYLYIDSSMLMAIKGEQSVGIYHGGFRLYQIMTIIPSALGFTMFPVLARTYEKENDTFHYLSSNLIRWLILLVLPLSASLIIYAEDIIFLVFGSTFSLSIPVFQLLMIVLPFTFLVSFANVILVSMNLHKTSMKLFSATIFLNIIMNFVLIPQYGAKGAALGMLVSELFFVVMAYALLHKFIKKDIRKILPAALFCTGIMSLFLALLKEYTSIFITGILAGWIVYIFSMILSGNLGKKDLAILLQTEEESGSAQIGFKDNS